MGNLDVTPSRYGASNGGADKWALFLKVFGGEVLSLFEQKTVMKPLITVRNISQGKSATFPLYGSLAAKFHKPGENLLESSNGYLTEVKFAERVLNIDGQLVAGSFVADIDELLNHWDVRGPIATEIGRQLAYYFDRVAIATMIAAARTTTAPITYKTSGNKDLVGWTDATTVGASWSAGNFINACYNAAVNFDQKDVPEEGRVMLVSPDTYWKLINSGNAAVSQIMSSDYSRGNADVASGRLYQIAGFRLVKTPLLPSVNMLADSDTGTTGTQIDSAYQVFAGQQTTATSATGTMPNYSIKNDPFGAAYGYAADFSKTLAVCGHGMSVGCVQKHDITTESERKIEYQGTLMLGKLMTGFGVLRPECAGEIRLT
jgi:hypothetical protein